MLTLATGIVAILIAAVALAVVFALPSAWLLMLFLGNLGLEVSFFDAIPGGLLIGALAGRVVTATKE